MADTPQYIFGYGSLVESKSRARTWAPALYASPVIVKGIRRGWFDNTGAPGLCPTYLGAALDDDHKCNGVMFSISSSLISVSMTTLGDGETPPLLRLIRFRSTTKACRTLNQKSSSRATASAGRPETDAAALWARAMKSFWKAATPAAEARNPRRCIQPDNSVSR